MQRTGITARRALDRFFFTNEVPFGSALMRIALPLVMMTMVLPRWRHARELYSADGATAQLALGYGYPNFMPEFSGEVVVALNSLLIVALLCAIVGWQTRVSLLISFVLYPYFAMLDSISTMTKYSVITTHLLLLLSCSNCGAIWSVDAWLARRRDPARNLLPTTFPVWPRRLAQLLIGIVYFGAAITKMTTPTFLSGDQMQLWMLTHINFRHPIGEWLSMYPVLIKSMAYACLIWEVTFVFLVWNRAWRPLVLTVGITFHFLTTLTLGLFIFPMTCYAAYLAFVEEDDFLNIRHAVRSWMRRTTWWPGAAIARAGATWSPYFQNPEAWRRPAACAFPAVLLLVAVAGVSAEHQLDPYGIRRPDGPYELVPLEPEFAAKLLAPPERVRDKDKFFAIDTGLLLVGDLLADRRKVFRHGDKMIAQCHLVPPHEDMWIECRMLDSHNRIVQRSGNIALRESFRINFEYPITTAFEPGDYSLVFETGGREVLRKRISIVGKGSAVAAH